MANVLLVGCGGIGTIAALNLQSGGKARVTTVLRSNYDHVKQHGFHIRSLDHGVVESFRPDTIRNSVPNVSEEDIEPYKYIVCTTRNIADIPPSLSELIRPAVTPGYSVIVLIRNGLNIEKPILDAFPQNIVLSSVRFCGSHEIGTGQIVHEDHDRAFIGAFDNPNIDAQAQQDAAKEFVEIYKAGGKCSPEYQPNVGWTRWRKLLYNACLNSICAVTDLYTGRMQLADGAIDNLVRPAMQEIRATAKAYGHDLPEELMLAIGGTIGTGLFVGTGEALAIAGPAPLLGVYVIICILVYGIITATSEMSTYLPVPGCSMAYYANRFVSRSLGFALGWLYFYSFAILVAYEITAAGLVIDYWPNEINIAVWILIMLVVVIVLNLCPVRVYGETEFWFASLKVFMILGLLVLSVKYPGPAKEYLVPGAAGRLCGVVYVACFSVFSFNIAPELLVITAGEMHNPRRNLPKATKRYCHRLLIFYVLGVLAIGVICNSNAPGLLSGEAGAAASPWVITIKEAGIKGLDSVTNAVIVTSAWSSANSFLYMSSRSLYSLAVAGNAPQIFTRCSRWGAPHWAVLVSCVLGLLAYLNCGNDACQVLNWLINLTNTAGFTSWVCCGITYTRFRMACQAQAVTSWC